MSKGKNSILHLALWHYGTIQVDLESLTKKLQIFFLNERDIY